MILIILVGVVACFSFQELLKGITLSRQSIKEKNIIGYSYIYQDQVINLFYDSPIGTCHPKFCILKKILLEGFREAPFHRQLFEFESFLEKSSEGLLMNLITYPELSSIFIPMEFREIFPNQEQQLVLTFYLGNDDIESNSNSTFVWMRSLLLTMVSGDIWKFRSLQNALYAWRDFLIRFGSCFHFS